MEELRVVAENLRGKAAAIRGLTFPDFLGDRIQAPSGLPFSDVAAENISQNQRGLVQYMTVATNEKLRLAETLESVANAYDQVDQQWQQQLDADGRAAPEPVVPRPPSTPALPPPFPISKPAPVHDDGGFRTPPDTEAALGAGDQGASLTAAVESWLAKSGELTLGAEEFQAIPPGWDGSAAESADVRFGAFKAWLDDLALTWQDLAAEAAKVALAHTTARAQHTPVAEEYVQLERVRLNAMLNGNSGVAVLAASQMQTLQNESEDIRDVYSRNSSTDPAVPGDVPPATGSSIPVSATDGPIGRARETKADYLNPTGGGGPQGSGGGGGAPPSPAGGGGGAPPLPQSPGLPHSPAPGSTGGPASSGGTPSGGTPPGGGLPSGGGAPGGGMPGGLPGGLPGGGSTAKPKLSGEPSVKPAAAGGGGVVGGAGGGGGGRPGSPMGPAIGAETVASAPGAARVSAPVGAGPGTAGAMGGMGGMAPMGGHGGRNGQGQERKRTPGLSPDDDLYTEERPWTEAVIGNRRRKEVQDGSRTVRSPGE